MADLVEARQSGSGVGYRSTGALTTAILSLVGVHVLCSFSTVISLLVFQHGMDGRDFELVQTTAAIVQWADRLQSVTFFAAAICFLYWVHRAYTNLPALGSESLTTMSPRHAVTGFITPFYNFVHGYKAVHVLYLESQRPAILPSGFVLPTRAAIVGWWWSAYLARFVSIKISNMVNGVGGDDAILWVGIASVLDAIAGVLFAVVVWRVFKRQHDQHDDQTRRVTQQPQPSADYLR